VTTLAGGQGPSAFLPPGFGGTQPPGRPLDGTGSAAQFGNVLGISTDSLGDVFVTDFDEVREITPSGVVSTSAGLYQLGATTLGHYPVYAPEPANLDGRETQARFNSPAGIAIDSAGDLYVADSGNNSVRLLTKTGFLRELYT